MPLRSQPLQQALPAEVLVRDGQDPVSVRDVERVALDAGHLERRLAGGGEHRYRARDEPDPQPGHVVESQAGRSLDAPLARRHSTRPSIGLTSTPNDISHFVKVKMYREWPAGARERRPAGDTTGPQEAERARSPRHGGRQQPNRASQSSSSSSRARKLASRSTATSKPGLRSTKARSRSASQVIETCSSPRRSSSSSMPRSVKYNYISSPGGQPSRRSPGGWWRAAWPSRPRARSWPAARSRRPGGSARAGASAPCSARRPCWPAPPAPR